MMSGPAGRGLRRLSVAVLGAAALGWMLGPAGTVPPASGQDRPAGQPAAQSGPAADQELARLFAGTRGVRAATARGQTIHDAPPFKVVPRTDRIGAFPCTQCHDNKLVDRRVRELQEEHLKIEFRHGGGRFWCYDACHRGTDMDRLVSLRGRPIEYDESYKLCQQCHFQRLDWYFGGHGKRSGAWPDQREIPPVAAELKVESREDIGRWRGERVILNCTECHDPHSPSIKPFEPSPPPKVRSGLVRRAAPPAHPRPWERAGGDRGAH
jgi:hypothetical protein